MICPSCQAEQPDPAPRFCDACGLALPKVRRAAAPAGTGSADVRCQECGVVATARRCRGCGARVRWPEDVIPPDEQGSGKPVAPALELEGGEGDEDLGVEIVDLPPRGHDEGEG
jgi:hypothetical protein